VWPSRFDTQLAGLTCGTIDADFSIRGPSNDFQTGRKYFAPTDSSVPLVTRAADWLGTVRQVIRDGIGSVVFDAFVAFISELSKI
jgi:hypothetical protein